MNDFPRMLYRAGGDEAIHGGQFTTLIVHDAVELDAALAGGWFMTTTEAAAPAPADDDTAPTRAELEQKATELGIEFSARIGDAKLAERIEAAIKEQK